MAKSNKLENKLLKRLKYLGKNDTNYQTWLEEVEMMEKNYEKYTEQQKRNFNEETNNIQPV